MGRSAERANVVAAPEWLARQGFEVHETDRGGDVTYHGPGQIVGYPVLDLSDRPDVRRFVGALEDGMIRVCAEHGIEAARHPEHRGAWIGPRKVGAVGVHLSRWITSHGLAFNLSPDLAHFRAIVPCGIADPRLGVTSLAAELTRLGRPVPGRAEVEDRLALHLAEALHRSAVPSDGSRPQDGLGRPRGAGRPRAAPPAERGEGRLLAAGDRAHRGGRVARGGRGGGSCSRRPARTCRSRRSGTRTRSRSIRR